MAIAWAVAEMALDQCAYTLFIHYGGDSIEKKIPRNLSGKISFIEACFKRLPALAPMKDHCLSLMRLMTEAGEDRHWCIHGAIGELRKFEEGDTLTLLRTAHKNNQWLSMESRQITVSELYDIAFSFRALARRGQELSDRLAAPFEHLVNKPAGEVPS
jgi:hypothetical protein